MDIGIFIFGTIGVILLVMFIVSLLMSFEDNDFGNTIVIGLFLGVVVFAIFKLI